MVIFHRLFFTLHLLRYPQLPLPSKGSSTQMSRRKRRVNNFTEEKNPINRQFTLPEGFGDFAAIADTASNDLKEILVFGDKDVFNLRRDPNNDSQMGHLNCHQLFFRSTIYHPRQSWTFSIIMRLRAANEQVSENVLLLPAMPQLQSPN